MLKPGTILQGRYHVIEVINEGGMSVVYLATDSILGNRVAVKEMKDHFLSAQEKHQAAQQFLKEAQILASLEHANLPRVTNFFEQDQKHYLVMDYIKGRTLEAVVQDFNGPLPEPQVTGVAVEVCKVLDYLHNQNPPVIFRDLKPSNIMLTEDGRVKLIDFGISKSFDTKTGTRTIIKGAGTPGFAPPEQYGTQGRTRTDVRTDLYSLGATMYALLTMEIPAEATDRWMNEVPLVPPAQFNARISPEIEALVIKLMELKPEDRCASAREVMEVLRRYSPDGAADDVRVRLPQDDSSSSRSSGTFPKSAGSGSLRPVRKFRSSTASVSEDGSFQSGGTADPSQRPEDGATPGVYPFAGAAAPRPGMAEPAPPGWGEPHVDPSRPAAPAWGPPQAQVDPNAPPFRTQAQGAVGGPAPVSAATVNPSHPPPVGTSSVDSGRLSASGAHAAYASPGSAAQYQGPGAVGGVPQGQYAGPGPVAGPPPTQYPGHYPGAGGPQAYAGPPPQGPGAAVGASGGYPAMGPHAPAGAGYPAQVPGGAAGASGGYPAQGRADAAPSINAPTVFRRDEQQMMTPESLLGSLGRSGPGGEQPKKKSALPAIVAVVLVALTTGLLMMFNVIPRPWSGGGKAESSATPSGSPVVASSGKPTPGPVAVSSVSPAPGPTAGVAVPPSPAGQPASPAVSPVASASPGSGAPTGQVRIGVTSEPAGGKVFVDGKEAGVSSGQPLWVTVEPGKHQVKVAKQGYFTHVDTVETAKSGDKTVALHLTKESAARIKCNVDGAAIFIDGKASGRAPATVNGLKEGKHEYTVRAGGYGRVTGSFTVEEGQVKEVTVTLTAIPVAVPRPVVITRPVAVPRPVVITRPRPVVVPVRPRPIPRATPDSPAPRATPR